MKNKYYKFLLLLLLVILSPITVDAEVIQFNLCFGDNGAFSITYDDQVATEVKQSKIDYDAVLEGHIPYPDDVDEAKKEKYEFTVSGIANKCYVENNKITYCPSNSQLNEYKVVDTYLADGGVSNKIQFVFSEATGKFNIKIKDVYNDKLYVRHVYGNRVSNKIDELDASNFKGQFLTRSSDGYYNISGISSKTNIVLEFYIKSGNCSGSYIGYIAFNTPNSYNYEVDNPVLANPSYYGCNLVKAYVPTGMVNTEDIKKFNDVKKSYISECYSSGKIKYGEKANLKETIADKFTKLKEMFTSYIPSSATGGNECTQQYSSGNRITYTYTGNYWSIVCNESYTASGDEAKLVKAGDGFSYQANYKVVRTCTIIQINRPTKIAKCSYNISHSCSWPTKSGTGTGQDAGPNDDFDSCVSSCDGGKYTQSCINSCYSKVYKNNRDVSFTDKFSYSNTRLTTSFVNSYYGANSSDSCTTDHNRPGNLVTHCENGACDSACFSDWCGNHGGSCTFYTYKTPDVCEDDPDTTYNNALNASQAELNQLISKQKEIIPKGSYTYKITDSYLETSDGKPYVFTVNSDNDPALKVESSQTNTGSSYTTQALGNSGGSDVSYNAIVTSTANITVNLPLSYLDKINGNAVYKTNESSKTAFSINNIRNRFDTVNNFDKAKYYNDNERKYYTSIWSQNINAILADGKVNLMRTGDYNIKVESSNVGSGNFSSNINCYYGVYNKFYCIDPDDCPDKDDYLDTSGIQWIYRPIELTDVFPNDRSPRWNWTGTLGNDNTYTGAARYNNQTTLKYNINPEQLTKEIESKGSSIYDVQRDSSEVDYEFVLTTENLRNIRNYNKKVSDYNGDGAHNYLDYNMSCYTNSSGKEVCTSKFLDNISENSGTESAANFITYSVAGFTIDARKNLAGCNNSKNGACVEIGR